MVSKTKFLETKKIVFVSYLTVFGFLAYNSLRILKSYGIVSLTLKTSFNIAADIAKISLNFEHFFDKS